jgi:DNA sulfur modification protein DndC
MRAMELISLPELHEIRRIWVYEKHEIEDSLPGIYNEVTGETFPGKSLTDQVALGADDISVLRDICGDDPLHFEMTRSLLSVERRYRTMARRAGLLDEMEEVIRRSFYDGVEDASERARDLSKARQLAKGSAKASVLDSEADGAVGEGWN